MLDFTEHNLTDAVVDRFGACENPRLKQIVQAITRHVHAFVKEVELTQDEWVEAIDFLTKTGHMCDDRRQELDRKSTRLNSSHSQQSRMPSSA